MAASLTLTVVEIIVLLFGAVILGITIHFFIASRKSLKKTTEEFDQKNTFVKDEWKLKYFNDMDAREKESIEQSKKLDSLNKEINSLKHQLQESEENVSIYSMEAEEMHKINKSLKAEMEKLRQATGNGHSHDTQVEELQKQVRQLQTDLSKASQHSGSEQTNRPKDYLDQLREAQFNLIEQNQKINQILGNIDVIKEKEEMQELMNRNNEELTYQIEELQIRLSEKESEIHHIRQKEMLTKEMSSMLDQTHNDFNLLKEKISKLEIQLTSSKMTSMEFEDLKEAHTKLNKDLDDYRLRNTSLVSENQDLKLQLNSLDDQFRDANFQRVQLQKKVAYLEELNNDLHVVSDANRKLEGQIKRIGELESKLNIVSEERDNLIEKTQHNQI